MAENQSFPNLPKCTARPFLGGKGIEKLSEVREASWPHYLLTRLDFLVSEVTQVITKTNHATGTIFKMSSAWQKH